MLWWAWREGPLFLNSSPLLCGLEKDSSLLSCLCQKGPKESQRLRAEGPGAVDPLEPRLEAELVGHLEPGVPVRFSPATPFWPYTFVTPFS